MIYFFTRYRVTIVIVLVITLLIWFFIPNQERYYLHADIGIIQKQSRTTLIWAIAALGGLLFLLAIPDLRSIKAFLNVLSGIAFLVLMLYFLLGPVFLSGSFFLNKLRSKTPSEKQYRVIYNDDSKEFLLLHDMYTQRDVVAGAILRPYKKLDVQTGDTVFVSFNTGWLGYEFVTDIRPQ